MKKLYFFFPYEEECGVPVLFLRMSRWVADHHGDEFDCYIVDYPGGAMARNITAKDKIKVLPYTEEEGCTIEDDAMIIFQSFRTCFWPENLQLSPKTQVFWWTLHVRCLAPLLIPEPAAELTFKYNWLYKAVALFYWPFMHRFAKLVDDMIAAGALYFMDAPTFMGSVEHIPMKTQKIDHYLPVPASDYDGVLKSKKSVGELNVCWLGRLSDEKTPILKYTIRKLSDYALQHQQKITLHVLGWGEHKEEVDSMELDNEYFHQLKSRPIKSVEINGFLLQNIDVMFAMGTSALEAAKLGIPTVMVDATYEEIKGDYVFKAIYERTGYELAHLITRKDFERGNKSFERIMDLVNNHFEDFSQKSREYFLKNHAISSVGEQFVSLIKKSDFTFDRIDPKVMESLWQWEIWVKIRKKMTGKNKQK